MASQWYQNQDGIWVSRVTKSGRLLLDGPGPRTSVAVGRYLCGMAVVHFGSLLAATALERESRRDRGWMLLSVAFALAVSVVGLIPVGRARGQRKNCAACCALFAVNFVVVCAVVGDSRYARKTAIAAAIAGTLMLPELFAVGLAAAAVEIVRLAGDGWGWVAGCLLMEVVCVWMWNS